VLLGAHVSVAGGLPSAFGRAQGLGCTALQVFVKNASRWQGRVLEEAEVTAFRAAWEACPGAPVVAHAAYLINLAAPPGEVLERSRAGLADELVRSARLGLAGLVVHPGSHGGAGEEEGLRRVAASIDEVFAAADADLASRPSGAAGASPRAPSSAPVSAPERAPRLLLETTAGQGACLGWRLEHLERIVELSRHPERLAVCLDTCHLFAAGYAVDTPEGIDAVLGEVVARFGRQRLACVHLNDSRHPLGSRRDRHANIGEGALGRAPFAHLLRHPLLAGVPMVVETPGGDDDQGHARDLALLRELAMDAPSRRRPRRRARR
jgi:deoxyribonuclease-4